MDAPLMGQVCGGATALPALGPFARASAEVPRRTGANPAIRFFRALGRVLIGLRPSTWLLVDVVLLSAALAAGYRAFPPVSPDDTPHVALWQAVAVFSFALIVASLVFGLYERETLQGRSRILTRALLTTFTAAVAAYAIIYIVMYCTVSRRVTGFAFAVFLTGGIGVRLWAWLAIHQADRRLLVVGSRGLFDSFIRAKGEGLLPEYQIVGFADEHVPGRTGENDAHLLGDIERLPDLLDRHRVTDIVVGAAPARGHRAMEWLAPCLGTGRRVTNEATFYEKAVGQILVDEITPNWFLFADLKVHCDERATLKRLVDLIIAGAAFLVSAPLWPLIALGIKLCDGGPVFYSQERVGQNGRPFRLHKFRTMRIDAENGRSVWCAPNDPRVTRVGRFLRRTRIDEWPQLYNVLVGQMSLVGPRPERPDIVSDLREKLPYYAERHLVKPGITGWAQISFRYGASIEDARRKLQYDLYYLKHMSFELDLIILFRTLGTFLKGAC